MANDVSVLTPKIIAQGLLALRNLNVMPRLVNSDYSTDAAKFSATIDVPIPTGIAAQVVTPNNIAPATADYAPSKASIALNQWYEAPFYLSDKDMKEADERNIFPMAASDAIKALADTVNAQIFTAYKGVYGYTGTAGSTPFNGATTDITNTRKILAQQKCPIGDRRFVIDVNAEANALSLTQFQNYYQSNDPNVMSKGVIGNKFGFDWTADQQVPTHAAGTQTGTVTVNGAQGINAGTTDGGLTGTLSIATAAASSTAYVAGDILTLAGDTQTYVVVTAAGLTLGASANGSITIAPALKVAQAGGAAITVKAAHVVNLAFHRNAIAFANRPLEDVVDERLGAIIETAVDPVTGIALRLEVRREYKRTRWSFDMLWGSGLVRRELATRCAG